MRPLRFEIRILPVGVMLLGSGVACCQDPSTGSGQVFPGKQPIRIITSAPGGSSDFVARQIALAISEPLGQQVIVDNRAAGNIPIEAVYRAPPDGYTVLVAGGSFWIVPLLQKTAYDPAKDFAPITIASRAVNILAVHPSMPVNSVKELIALAKAKPGQLNYASAATGGTQHLMVELFKSMAGVDIVRIPYKGGGPALIALLSGEVQMTMEGPAPLVPHIKLGKLRALAVTSAEPSALAPGLPTVAASGVPGYQAETLQVIFAPAKTPAAVISRLNQEMVRFLKQPAAKEKFLNAGTEAVGSSPEQLTGSMKTEMDRLGKLIKDIGLRAD